MPAILHVALGGNCRHGRYGAPRAVLAAAMTALDEAGLTVISRSTVRQTLPLGPRQRRFANAVIGVSTDLPLIEVLGRLKAVEATFGRRRGRRWGARVLDLDLVAAGPEVMPAQSWRLATRGLIVPHRGLAVRRFVIDPLVEIAAGWRHPVLHLTARQLRARLYRPRRSPTGSP